jgi:hypothetical protein
VENLERRVEDLERGAEERRRDAIHWRELSGDEFRKAQRQHENLMRSLGREPSKIVSIRQRLARHR